jgi:hypothetical protein
MYGTPTIRTSKPEKIKNDMNHNPLSTFLPSSTQFVASNTMRSLLTSDSRLQRTWSDFNAFYWLYRLSYALLDAIVPCREKSRRKLINQWLRPLMPSLGITITLLCVSSYFTTFRGTAVIKKGKSEALHTVVVVWLALNILSHYLYCINKSPGIVVPQKLEKAASSSLSGARRSNDLIKLGGCCFRVKISEEKKRSNFYRMHCTHNVRIESTENTCLYHPSHDESFCHKCDMNRPPRSHHCRICKLCVLEYDHHCPWVANCIGYNNYRNFVLLVFYSMLGCFYGAYMLAHDFYNMMREQLAASGLRLFGKYGTGILDLPPPWILLKDYRDKGKIDDDVVLRAAFPFFLLVSVCMFVFLLDILQNIARGNTTLEKKTRPNNINVVNPFDLGPRKNFEKVFGKSLIKIILPF